MTMGYIMYTQTDIQVSTRENMPFYMWRIGDGLSFHSVSQAPLHPIKNDLPYPKWINDYIIETPEGYSCLFTNPMHNPNNIFTIMPGVVDTDKYKLKVNFPFVLNDPNWRGIIPAGTPMVQVIPFKRDSWKHVFGSKKDIDYYLKYEKRGSIRFFNNYKLSFWNKKDYR